MSFREFLGAALRGALLTGLAIALILGVAIAVNGSAHADFQVDLELERFDGLWLVVLFPLLLWLLTLLVSPLSYLLWRLLPKPRRDQSRDAV
ncbi:MAG: hypothetical protein AAF933_04460 [Pseudomonadota bacterium]